MQATSNHSPLSTIKERRPRVGGKIFKKKKFKQLTSARKQYLKSLGFILKQ